jgi:hypothetical protein
MKSQAESVRTLADSAVPEMKNSRNGETAELAVPFDLDLHLTMLECGGLNEASLQLNSMTAGPSEKTRPPGTTCSPGASKH